MHLCWKKGILSIRAFCTLLKFENENFCTILNVFKVTSQVLEIAGPRLENSQRYNILTWIDRGYHSLFALAGSEWV